MSESLRNILQQEIRDKFPGLDWRLGSVFRELVVEPLCKLADKLDSSIASATASLDVKTICENPLEYEEELDSWLSRLGLTINKNPKSTGMVRIICSSGDRIKIPRNTAFTWNGEIAVYVSEDLAISSVADPNRLSTDIAFNSYNGLMYSADIPVSSSDTYGGTLDVDTPLNWVGAPAQVHDIYISSAVSGGRTMITAADKANILMSSFTQDGMSGTAGIKKCLIRNFPNVVQDAKTGKFVKGEGVNIYIKPTKQPAEFEVSALTDTNGVTTISGCGIYRVVSVYSVSDGKYLDYSYTYEGSVGSSSSSIKIETDKTREAINIKVLGFGEYSAIKSWLDGEGVGSPFSFNLAVPAVGSVKLSSTVSGTVPAAARTEISEYITALPIDSTVSGSDISKILSKYGVFLTRSPVFSISVLHRGITRVYTDNGISGGLLGMLDGDPLALYANENSIELKNVE